MTEGEYQPVTVSRRINSSAHDIFQILANPARHREFDGSDSLRGATSTAMVLGVGDVFVRIWSTTDWSVTKDIVNHGKGTCQRLSFSPRDPRLV